MNKSKGIYIALVLWLIIGLILRLDYPSSLYLSGVNLIKLTPEFWNFEQSLFKYQITFFVISIILLSIAFLVKKVKFAQSLIMLELMLWILRLYILKQGYSQGIVGSPNEEVVFYDFTGLTLRLFFLAFYFKIQLKPSVIILLFLVAGSILYLKIAIFPTPIYFLY